MHMLTYETSSAGTKLDPIQHDMKNMSIVKDTTCAHGMRMRY